jgi:GNAT superfamily N-acetyltransferase
MIFRDYTDQDIDKLLHVWWESWHSSASFKHPLSIDAWRARWENLLLTHKVALIESSGRILGFAAVEPDKKQLSQIFVTPSHKGNGYGKILFEWAKSICGDRMKLKTLVENSEARSFYRSLGMREVGCSINDFNGKEEVEYAFGASNEGV